MAAFFWFRYHTQPRLTFYRGVRKKGLGDWSLELNLQYEMHKESEKILAVSAGMSNFREAI